ncbi:hypothetical protein PS914_01944 [Pseudomonas fluorescens]|uniref:EpsG family protein n=1 Tax=Pseudomonas fluorescens TaxID=294 RepID=UPI00123F61A3|nr:EpsG family protein [Pseudomonas fluorescens]VVP78225.1 hypothetical protein PS914_01944 [Pseudomonas fluorescens]
MSRSKLLSIVLAFPVFLVMWILYGWNYWNGDRSVYESYYTARDTLASWGGEVGYGSLNVIASQSGLSFQSFQILISLLTLYLVFRYVIKRAVSPLASLILYLVCFFSLDFVLMRNFLSFAIILQGVVTLFEAKPYCKIKYALIVLFATTVHQSSLFFMVFLFMPLNRVVPLRSFCFVYLMFVFSYVLIRLNVPLPVSVATHFSYYNTTLKSSFANVIAHVISMVLMTFVVLAERKSLRRVECTSGRDKELAFILNLNLFSLFFLVLYFESEIFIRLFRTVLFFNVLHCVNALFLPRRTYSFLICYILIFSSYLMFFFLFPVAQFSLFPLLKNNLLLN